MLLNDLDLTAKVRKEFKKQVDATKGYEFVINEENIKYMEAEMKV